MALVDFEIAVRDLVSNVENAYWDLYYGYRDLDAKVHARDEALKTWRSVYALYETGRSGGEAENEAQAREQYFRFQEEVQNALSGELLDGTRVGNGSGGGTFRPTGGVLVAERRLRVLMGMLADRRPADSPGRRTDHGQSRLRLGTIDRGSRPSAAPNCAGRSGTSAAASSSSSPARIS